jgi:hypothetical protein
MKGYAEMIDDTLDILDSGIERKLKTIGGE